MAFVLDNQITEELQVGQPVSIGVSEREWGSISLDEFSVVRAVVRGLRRETKGPTLEALYAETIGRRPVA